MFERQKRALDPAERKRLTREFEQYSISQAYNVMLFWWQRIVVHICALHPADSIRRRGGAVDERALPYLVQHGRSKGVPGAGDPAANHIHGKVEDVNQIGNYSAQRDAHTAKDFARRLITLHCHVIDHLRAELRILLHAARHLRRCPCCDRFCGQAFYCRG